MRGFLIISAATLAISLIVMNTRRPAPVEACSPAPPSSHEPYLRTDLVALVDVIAAGGAENAAPTLTPTPAPAVDTPTAAATPTGSRRFRIELPAATATPTATLPPSAASTPYWPLALDGRGATLRIAETYAGAADGELRVDDAWRAQFERDLREYFEGPYRSSCQPGGPPRYTVDGQYLVFVSTDNRLGTHTVVRYRVVDGEVVLNDPAFPPWEWGYLQVGTAAYRRFFAGIEYRDVEGATEPLVLITAARVPLENVLHLALAVRNGVILPPETGSAGLTSRR
ncbi:MAG: hypothetical protein WEC75_10020 [Dehalococcoidia bacterium]